MSLLVDFWNQKKMEALENCFAELFWNNFDEFEMATDFGLRVLKTGKIAFCYLKFSQVFEFNFTHSSPFRLNHAINHLELLIVN